MGKLIHGMTGTKIHNIWLGILDRCKNDRQGTYGKRGIKVCKRWMLFENFFADMGQPPSSGHSIDRIDNNGDYDPSNCRWSTRIQQARNTSRNTVLTHDGKSLTIAEWSEITGIKKATICVRLANYGWSVERTLTTKPQPRLPDIKPWNELGISRSSWYRKQAPHA